MWAKQKQHGFTIVELLIVIVVIGILAAITLVAYNSMQARARDSIRQNDIAEIAKALHLYNVDNGSYVGVGSGCGSGGNGTGWFDYDYDGGGPFLTTVKCLTDGGYLSKTLTDPSGLKTCTGVTCHAYIKMTCGTGTYLMANLESVAQSSTAADATCNPTYDTDLGVNYIVKVN